MANHWTWGSYAFPEAENYFDIDAHFVHSPIGRRTHSHVVLDLYGRRYAASQAALTLALAELEDELATDGKDLIYFDASGNPTRHQYLNSTTLDGVKATRLQYLRRRPRGVEGTDEYVLSRSYRIRFEFDVLNNESSLVQYRESVRVRGNGRRSFVIMEALTGPPQEQTTKQFTKIVAVQSGFAVGYLQKPSPSTPLFPAALHEDDQEVEEFTPQHFGRITNTLFGVRWMYPYTSATALTQGPAIPTF